MKKSLAVLAGATALSALGLVGATIPANAQAASGPFADVPTDHWAYQSVDTLQRAGIVIGYPDGTYGGRRPMTRYEFAVAIARLLPLINKPAGDFATTDQLNTLRSDLEGRLSKNEAALNALQSLVNEFQPELQKLGQDVAAVNARLGALEGRVSALEAEQARVKFTGDLNIIGYAAGSQHKAGTFGYVPFSDKNGNVQGPGGRFGVGARPRATGNGGSDTTGPGSPTSARLLENSDVYNDFLLGIRGKISDTATANVKIDFGNYISTLENTSLPGNAESVGLAFNNGDSSTNTGTQQVTIWEAYLDAPVSLGPAGGAELQVGRFPNQMTKWTLQQPDADVYTYLYQTDSGNVPTDGGKLNLKVGPAAVQLWAGKLDTIPFSQISGGTNALARGASQAGARPTGAFIQNTDGNLLTQGAGVRATFGAPEGAILGVTVEQFAFGSTIGGVGGATPSGGSVDPDRSTSAVVGNAGATQYNRLSVYGLDFNGGLPFFKTAGLTLDAAYNVSAHGANSSFNGVGNGMRYTSHEEQLGAKFGALSVKGGYQFIGPYYSAPGYWGKVGAWTNPSNVKGPVVSAKYAFSPKLTLNADAEFYKAAYGGTKNGLPLPSSLQQDDQLTRYQIGLGYGLSSTYAVDLGYEDVYYKLKNKAGLTAAGNGFQAGTPRETYLTLGIGHTFNKNASFKLLYQIISYKDQHTGFNSTGGNPRFTDFDERGSVAVGQFSLKF